MKGTSDELEGHSTLSTKLRKRLYADSVVNGGRQAELDMAKFVAICCLALVHCTVECTPESGLVSGIPYLFDTIIGGPLSAPLFMFTMGIGMVYTKNNSTKAYAGRGLKLIVIGYLLNICRFLIPFLIGYALTGNYDKYILPLPYLVAENDVLLFAGLAMIVLSLFVRLRLSDAAILCIALGMSIAGTCLNGTDAGTPAGNILLGYLIGTEDHAGMVRSYFPLMNWMIVPASGYIFGKRLRRVKSKKLFYGLLSPVCILITIAYFWFGISNELGMFGEGQNCYYHITTPDIAASLCAACGLLGIYHVIIRYVPSKMMHIVQAVSRNINAVYCIHWVLVSMIINVFIYAVRGTQELPIAITMVLGTGIGLGAMGIAHLWRKWTFRKGGCT